MPEQTPKKLPKVTVTVRKGCTMPLEKGGIAESVDTVTISAEYYKKVSYLCEPLESDESEKASAKSKK